MNQLHKRIGMWLLTLLLLLNVAAVPALAQKAATAADPLTAHIEKLLADLARDENSIGLHAGIAVYDLQ
ncbi:MAG: hypothetical protein ACOYIL_15525, partial [Brevibacillus sp.]